MTTRHAAFSRKRVTRLRDAPHTLTKEERDYVVFHCENNTRISSGMARKLLRLYDERTAVGQQLMRELGVISDDHDPEKG